MSENCKLTILKGLFFDYFTSNEKIKNYHEFVYSFLSILKQELQLEKAMVWKRITKHTYTLQYSTEHNFQNRTSRHVFPPQPFMMNKDQKRAYLINDQSQSGSTVIELHGIQAIMEYSSEWGEKLSRICFSFLESGWELYLQYVQKSRFKKLFILTEKLHSSMDKDQVLKQLCEFLKDVFPDLTFHLFLSHDYELDHKLPVKGLEQELNSNQEAMAAFISGTMQQKKVGKRKYYYAPIIGVQGVYGIIQLIAPAFDHIIDEDLMFLELASKAGGKALENAKLYEQTKRLVNDLQLINETTHKINKELRISETMKYMIKQMTKSFSSDEAAFVSLKDDGELSILPGSTKFFHTPSSKVYIHFIEQKICEEKDGIFIGDISNYIKTELPYQSLMAVPMVESENIIGFAVVLHKNPYAFSFDMYKLMQSLIYHSTLAFINAMLREELEMLVITDQLTKLYSRKYLDEAIQESIQQDQKGVFILVDIDNFKQINDTYGHQVGDEILRQVANIIKSNIRKGDIASRWGGEELAIYLPRADMETGLRVAERLVKSVEKSTNPKATISCGVSYWNFKRKISASQLFKRADDALYLAKNQGKNRVISELEL
ncbi:sensor domain-containing diguanylate cyclase [Aeribacillus alveayuensis]|uniref:Diguanylate cyclase (GGDEF)-like protein n=1 Tax=Aeribacillus alveayuensis TaxID=279215 RepID=A0ABT9VJA5_9BACI|nr:diguanylate cyclase (GGDEF)-like protein [Bacillus alveayuensis]